MVQPSLSTSNENKPTGWRALGAFCQRALNFAKASDRLRVLASTSHSSNEIQLSSNDYLGLRSREDFQSDCRAACNDLPVGAGSSRLLSGEHEIFGTVERKFAEFKGAESALYFPSGYAANEALAQVFSDEQFTIFSDELNHASIIDGIKLATRGTNAKKNIFCHLDYGHLRELLSQSPAPCNIIWVESVYSMDGDVADLHALQALAREFRGVLVVDEAHGVGLYGPRGGGVVNEQIGDISECITVSTAGKALAVQGAFVAGPKWLRDYLINFARPFIYTTGPSPWLAAALQVSLQYVARMDTERARLKVISQTVRSRLTDLGLNLGTSTSHIIPIHCGENAKALAWETALKEQNIVAKAIRPPTVAPGFARLRISLHAGLTIDDVEKFLQCVSTLCKGDLH